MVKLSIVIANYNNAKYLERCVESIYKSKANFSFEVIIIDDCSTDNSKVVMKKLEKKYTNLYCIFKETNKSVGDTRNMAFYNTNSEYILNFDADDYFINNFLETISNFKSDWGDILIFNYYYEFFKANEKLKYKNLEDFQNKKEWQLLWNKIIRRDLVVQKNLKFYETNMYDDVSAMVNIRFEAKKINHISKSLVYYSYNSNSIVQSMFSEKNVKELKNNTQEQLQKVIIHVVNQSKNNEKIFSYAKKIYKMNVHYSFLDEGIPEINMFYDKKDYRWTPYKALTFLMLWILFNSKFIVYTIQIWNKVRRK